MRKNTFFHWGCEQLKRYLYKKGKTMMNQELLYRFFAGEATPEEIQKIKEWTEASKENRLELYREHKRPLRNNHFSTRLKIPIILC